MVIFYGVSKSSIVGNNEYKANNEWLIISLLALYSLFPLCETSLKIIKNPRSIFGEIQLRMVLIVNSTTR